MFDDYVNTLCSNLKELFEGVEDILIEDSSGYVNVDGEEGDYGIIKYYTKDKELVCTRTFHGGDSESVEYTPHGLEFLNKIAIWYILN